MKQLIISLVEKRIPFFQKLIRIPSLRGGERLVQMFVAEELKQLGLDVKLLQHQPAETLSDGSVMGPVTVGLLKGTGGGRSLILNFHVDTAPPGPEELWARNPFSGTVEDGLIHGRGAVDDKAGCIEVLLVLDCLNECGVRLKGDLLIQSVVEDEYSGRGTELCLKKGYRADAALIVDGHYGTMAALGNAGQLEFMLSLREKASPESLFTSSCSFVDDIALIIRKLALWSKIVDENNDPQWIPICSPGLNIGKISCKLGSEESAAKCSIGGLMKFGEPFTVERLMDLFRLRIERIAAARRALKRYDMELRFGDLRHNPIAVTADTDFFRALSESVGAVTGEPASTQICRGWCDMEYFWRDYNIPCYLYGPGRGRNAHGPDECFELDQFIPHTEVLVDLVKRWCGV